MTVTLAQPAHTREFRHQSNRANSENRVDQPSDVPDLQINWSVSEKVADGVDYRSYRLIEKYTRYEDDVAKKISKITKNTAVQMKAGTISGKRPVTIIAIFWI